MDTDLQAVPQMLPLPFDDGVDDAVPFVLTAAAHREVLGRDAPPLSAVPSAERGSAAPGVAADVAAGVAAGADDAPVADTRRVQARALLRSGMPVATIAAALGVSTGDIELWTGDLGDELARRRRRSTARRGTVRVPASAPAGVIDLGAGVERSRPQSERQRLVPGLALALAVTDEDGVAFLHHEVEAIAILLDAVRAELEVPAARIRVAVRVAPDVPSDRTRIEVAQRLGVDPTAIVMGRADSEAARPLELRVDVRDVEAGRLVRGWCEGGADEGTVEDGAARGPGRAGDDAGRSGLRGWDSNPQTFRLTADCSAN